MMNEQMSCLIREITSTLAILTWIMFSSWEGDRISHRNKSIRDGCDINQVPNAQLLKKYVKPNA